MEIYGTLENCFVWDFWWGISWDHIHGCRIPVVFGSLHRKKKVTGRRSGNPAVGSSDVTEFTIVLSIFWFGEILEV